MFYYQHHVGDYRRDTGHLTLLEHGIYRQLLDMYYVTEKPLDKKTAMRLISVRNTDECEAYYRVLTDFFQEVDGKYIHKRCEYEISKFKDKCEKATKSIKSRWNKNNDLQNTDVLQTNNEGNTIQTSKKPNILKTYQPTLKTNTVAQSACNRPEEVSESIWQDFLVLRKAKKAPLTNSALSRIDREAKKSGMSLENALIECCARGWAGFKADWVKKKDEPFDVGSATRKILERELEKEARLINPWGEMK